MPEKELYAAVIEQAFYDYKRNSGLRNEIIKWILGKRPARVNFEGACLAIDLDYEAVREKIHESGIRT